MARIGSWSVLVLLMIVFAVGCGGTTTQPEDQPDKVTDPEMADGDMTDVPPDAMDPEEMDPAAGDPVEDVPAVDEPAMDEPVDEPVADAPVVDEPAMDEPAMDEPAAEPMSPEEELLERLRAEKSIEQQKSEFLAEQAVLTAKALFDQSRLEEARDHAQKAIDLNPANEDARKLLHEILRSMGHRPGEFSSVTDQIREARKVKQEQTKAKAELRFNQGKEAFLQEDYDTAVEAFSDVLSIMNYSPFPVNWDDLRPQTEDYLAQAKEKQALRAEAMRREEARKAFETARNEELRRIQEAQAKIASILSAAYERFDTGNYTEAEALADEILRLDPRNSFALNLKDAASRGRHDQEAANLIKVQKVRFKQWLNDILETRIPYSGIVNFPSQREWDRKARLRAKHSSGMTGAQDTAEEIALANRLAEEVVTFDFQETPFSRVIDFIRNVRSMNLVIDERIKGDIDVVTVTLKVTDLPVRNVLELLLAYGGELVYTIRDNIVFITKPEFARGEKTLVVHPVGDLTMKLTQFIAPNLILKPAGSEFDEDQPQFGTAREGEATFTGPDELVDLIKQNVGDIESWEEEGVSATPYGNNIVITHSPEVQGEVAAFLDDLRRFSGLVVTIESRFLTVSKNFLREVGVDIKGLGGQKGPLALLDDVTSGLEDNAGSGFENLNGGLPSAAGTSPASGAFFNDGKHGDVRTVTEQIFDNAIGSVLTGLGGATVQYTYLDDVSLSVILRMVQKSSKARVMNAPSLTVFNTQRANITLVNQLSFIQDFDVEVAQTAFIADPIVGIVQDGLTLDVRPTVSNDRRYVTLELQPTVATLLRPIPTFTTSLGAFTTPVTIQIPEITIQKSQTTVRVPDGGTVVIGGLKNISVVDRRSATPWLSKIPLLGFFFKREGNSEEVNHLMIIITARITDLKAEEERFRR